MKPQRNGTGIVVVGGCGFIGSNLADSLLADGEGELAAHLGHVLGDRSLRDRLAAGALAHARRFTWEATATAVIQTLADEAERRRRQ